MPVLGELLLALRALARGRDATIELVHEEDAGASEPYRGLPAVVMRGTSDYNASLTIAVEDETTFWVVVDLGEIHGVAEWFDRLEGRRGLLESARDVAGAVMAGAVELRSGALHKTIHHIEVTGNLGNYTFDVEAGTKRARHDKLVQPYD